MRAYILRESIMNNQSNSDDSQNIHAGKLCFAAFISILLGVGLFFIFEVHSADASCSFVILGLVVPFLGLLAIGNILSNWRSIKNPDYVSKNETMIRKIAYRFLVTGLLFAIVSLVLEILVIFVGIFRTYGLPTLPSIWLIIMALLSLVMSCISYKLFTKTSFRLLSRIGVIVGILVGLLAIGAVPWVTNFGSYFFQRIEYSTMPEIPSVNSSSLTQTSIVPTLDRPCPKNKNVIWCSSFQLAWNRMKDDVIREPVEVVGAEEIAARLNSAEQTEDDLEPESFYAAAGRINQGIIDKIQKDMEAKFPKHSIPDFNDFAAYPRGILAYSYLIANVPFKYPYRQVRNEFIFTDSNGVETSVSAFGVWGYGSQYKRLREQAEILYFQQDDDYQMKEFMIDLCRHSKSYQVVVAMVEPKDSLAQTLDYINIRIADFKQVNNYERVRFLDSVDVLEVPEMFWEIDHRFDELIYKIVANTKPPMPILEAKQTIKFKLDRYGAVLESEATVFVAAIPRCFVFNRPFLVYMKKRDCDQPFFVMWIDNAELLNKK
jgi:hypothetical protein